MNAKPINRVGYSKSFEKDLRKAPLEIKKAWFKRLSIFLENPSHPKLRNHSLSGRLKGYRSINVTGDWRALYLIESTPTSARITFKALGTHSQLYR